MEHDCHLFNRGQLQALLIHAECPFWQWLLNQSISVLVRFGKFKWGRLNQGQVQRLWREGETGEGCGNVCNRCAIGGMCAIGGISLARDAHSSMGLRLGMPLLTDAYILFKHTVFALSLLSSGKLQLGFQAFQGSAPLFTSLHFSPLSPCLSAGP